MSQRPRTTSISSSLVLDRVVAMSSWGAIALVVDIAEGAEIRGRLQLISEIGRLLEM